MRRKKIRNPSQNINNKNYQIKLKTASHHISFTYRSCVSFFSARCLFIFIFLDIKTPCQVAYIMIVLYIFIESPRTTLESHLAGAPTSENSMQMSGDQWRQVKVKKVIYILSFFLSRFLHFTLMMFGTHSPMKYRRRKITFAPPNARTGSI